MIADGKKYSDYLGSLRKEREESKATHKVEGRKRQRLTPEERAQILNKTDSRCHICGGAIDGKWDADHVLSHSKGGEHSVDNYLPAHKTCNNYRWDYLSAEFQEIMKLGIWLRTQIENKTELGLQSAAKFSQYEKKRASRRRTNGRVSKTGR